MVENVSNPRKKKKKELKELPSEDKEGGLLLVISLKPDNNPFLYHNISAPATIIAAASHLIIADKLINKKTQRNPKKVINVTKINKKIPIILKKKSCNKE
jgi:hypothetical protein